MKEGSESEIGSGCVHCESAMNGDSLALQRGQFVGMTDLGAGGHEPPHNTDDDCRLFQCPKCATFWRSMYRCELAPDNSDEHWLRESWWCNKLTPAEFKELQALRRA